LSGADFLQPVDNRSATPGDRLPRQLTEPTPQAATLCTGQSRHGVPGDWFVHKEDGLA